MRNIVLTVAAVALIFGLAGKAMAADGNLSSSMLADMGLAGLEVMADAEGEKIRGKGFVIAGGLSGALILAPFGGAGSIDGALAVSHTHEARANQWHNSFAAAGVIGGPAVFVEAGGSSGGSAH